MSSSRRQARAGTVKAAARRDGLPPELASRLDPLWQDPTAVARLAAEYGLVLPSRHGSVAAATWWARFDAFRAAWCETHGLMSEQWQHTIDWRRARDAGIDMSASSRYRLRSTESR